MEFLFKISKMKNSAKYFIVAVIAVLSFSACTMGDKGSEKVPDSIKIDTTQKSAVAQPSAKVSDTTLIDSLQTDTTKPVKKP